MRELLLVASAVFGLAACGAEQSDGQSDREELALPSATPTETTTEPSAESSGVQRNDRGNIVKALGETGGMLDEETMVDLVTFAVDAIDPATCTDDWHRFEEGPENGHLITVSLRFATSPELAQDEWLSHYMVNPYDFSFVSPDGVTHSNLATMPTYGCLPGGEEFTSNPLAPGSQYVGKIVLDLPAPNGVLVYRPAPADGGWEWSF